MKDNREFSVWTYQSGGRERNRRVTKGQKGGGRETEKERKKGGGARKRERGKKIRQSSWSLSFYPE